MAVKSSGIWEWPLDDKEEWKNQEETVNRRKITGDTIVCTTDYFYWEDKEHKVVLRTPVVSGIHEVLGSGYITVAYSSTKKGGKTCTVKISDYIYKDAEIIPFNPNSEQNSEDILAFMTRYIFKPYHLLDNTVGVEVNFNKEFYVPETVEPVDSILAEIAEIDKELINLEKELGL